MADLGEVLEVLQEITTVEAPPAEVAATTAATTEGVAVAAAHTHRMEVDQPSSSLEGTTTITTQLMARLRGITVRGAPLVPSWSHS